LSISLITGGADFRLTSPTIAGINPCTETESINNPVRGSQVKNKSSLVVAISSKLSPFKSETADLALLPNPRASNSELISLLKVATPAVISTLKI